jgi:hypothetical protein
VALAVSNHYRQRLQYRFWRRAHYLNFLVWSAATVHGIGSGTDRSSPWLLSLYAVAVGAVAATTAVRFLRPRLGWSPIPLAGLAAPSAMLLVIWLALGPFRFSPRPWNAASFSEQLTGNVTQLTGVSRGIVSLVGQGQGRQNVLVRADLLVAPSKLLQTSFQMEYLPSAELCTGVVTQVHPTAFSATCRLPAGERRRVTAHWQPGAAGIAGGIITAARY